MSKNEFEKLMEIRWRRKLTAEEEVSLKAHLQSDASARRVWDEESALSHLLATLPDARLSTNFTAQVLGAVGRDAVKVERSAESVFAWLRFNWLPRIAIAALVLCGGLVSVKEYRATQRTQIAQNVAAMPATVPQEWLQNFEAINRLGKPPVDNDLLAALQ
jgi:hypothetical protein